ncbi:MAG: hypothetical protein NTU41_01755 [Chloroflexi bacterium]|nr:hypothetical protein [Chloroflexota bacterium]
MARIILLVVLVVLACGLAAGVAAQVVNVNDIAGDLKDMDTNDVGVEVTGLEDVNLVTLLPLMEVFMGRAMSMADISFPTSTQVPVETLSLQVPVGWNVVKDDTGADKAYSSGDSSVVVVREQPGSSAAISSSQEADSAAAGKLLSDTMNQQSRLLGIAFGQAASVYTVALPQGQAKAVDVQQGDNAVQVRGWTSGTQVYVVVLTSTPQNMAVSGQIFGSIS